MSFGAVAVGLGTAAIGSSASKSAAKSQANAANAAIANDQATFQQQVQLQQPFRQAGLTTNNRLMYLLGLGGSADGSSSELFDTTGGEWRPNADLYANDQEYRKAYDTFMQAHMNQYGRDPNLDIGSSLPRAEEGLRQAGFDVDAFRAQRKAENEASADYGWLQRRFGMKDFEADPGYQFRMDEGMRGVEGGAAARGGLLSGAALKAIQKYGQNFASNEYQNAYARDSADKTNIYNRLAGIVNTGQGATNQISNAAGQMGQSVSNNLIGAGNAQASGQIGAANAIAGGINQGFNTYNQNQLMNLIRQPSSTGWGTGSAYGNQDYGSYF